MGLDSVLLKKSNWFPPTTAQTQRIVRRCHNKTQSDSNQTGELWLHYLLIYIYKFGKDLKSLVVD